MTPAAFIEYAMQQQQTQETTLPAAPVDEAMYFATPENSPAVSENKYLPQQVILSPNSPIATSLPGLIMEGGQLILFNYFKLSAF